MSGPDNLSKIDRIRARDGDNCWLCGRAMDFAAEPNSAKAWSLEHLLSKAHGGSEKLENLALCHPPCNRRLANRSVVKKVEMREKQRRKAWLSAIRGQVLKVLGGKDGETGGPFGTIFDGGSGPAGSGLMRVATLRRSSGSRD